MSKWVNKSYSRYKRDTIEIKRVIIPLITAQKPFMLGRFPLLGISLYFITKNELDARNNMDTQAKTCK